MRQHTLGLAFLFCCLYTSFSSLQADSQVRIAIIGAGIGGSSTSYFLRKELGDSVTIEVFEKGKVGGRTQIFSREGKALEMGASIIHEQNKYFRSLADELGLKRVEPGMGTRESLLSIYDGEKFVFSQSSWTAVTLVRMVYRYGLSFFWFQRAPKALLAKFDKIYELQALGRAFATPKMLLSEIGLYNLTQRTMRTELKDVLGGGAAATRFAREFVAGVNHINYNQDNRLNAFAGMVSMLPTTDGRLFALEGGNYQLAVRLLAAAKAQLQHPMQIEEIERTKDGSYLLKAQGGAAKGPFAAVIIATPLELGNLSFKGFEPARRPVRTFQSTVTTIVSGQLQPQYFNVNTFPAGEYIMVAEGAHMPFSVIAPLTAYDNGTRLYKVFSSAVLGMGEVGRLFGGSSRMVAQHVWQAYPRFNPPESFADFEIGQGLFYSSAWENAASAMEMSAIGAKNSALLTKAFLQTSGWLQCEAFAQR